MAYLAYILSATHAFMPTSPDSVHASDRVALYGARDFDGGDLARIQRHGLEFLAGGGADGACGGLAEHQAAAGQYVALVGGGAIRFGGYFLRESLRGGWGVARHALSAPLAISPGLLRHTLHLPPGSARWFFCNTISLLPGTAVVAIEGDSLCVHVFDLSPKSAEELRDLEHRVAALFGLAWAEQGETKP